MKKIFLALLILSAQVAASEGQIAASITKAAKEAGIDARLLYTVVKIESNFEPLVISMVTSADFAEYFASQSSKDVEVKVGNHSANLSKKIVNFYPANEAIAIELVKIFKQQNLSFDVGLAQINSVNFTLDDAAKIVSIEGNLKRACEVLNACAASKGELKTSIECYNYGLRERNDLPYFNRFYSSFKKDFLKGK